MYPFGKGTFIPAKVCINKTVYMENKNTSHTPYTTLLLPLPLSPSPPFSSSFCSTRLLPLPFLLLPLLHSASPSPPFSSSLYSTFLLPLPLSPTPSAPLASSLSSFLLLPLLHSAPPSPPFSSSLYSILLH